MPRIRPCAVEMTGTVCCAHEGVGRRERERQRETRRDGNPKEGVLLVLSLDIMVRSGAAGRSGMQGEEKGSGEG